VHGSSRQEALVAAWRDLSGLRDPDKFDSWVHRILVRACHRSRHSRPGGRRSSRSRRICLDRLV
jgi:DNA-directed RNA polymerase specialized sigma24 family protein